MSSTRKFPRGAKNNYSNEEKLALGEPVEKCKKYLENTRLPLPPCLLIFGKFSNRPFYSNLLVYHQTKNRRKKPKIPLCWNFILCGVDEMFIKVLLS